MALELILKIKDDGTATVKKFTDTTKKGMSDVDKQTQKASKSMASQWTSLKSTVSKYKYEILALVGAVTSAVYAIKKITDETAIYRNEVVKMSKATGLTTETIAGLQYAVKIGTASIESLTPALRGLLRQMQGTKDGLAESKRAFDSLGISVLDAEGNLRPIDDVLFDVSDAMQSMTNDAEKAAVAQELLGRSGMEMVPLLEMGSQGIKDLIGNAKTLGLTFTDEAGKAAEDYQDSLADLSLAFLGLRMTIGEFVIPVITNLATGMTNIFNHFRVFAQIVKDNSGIVKEQVVDLGVLGGLYVEFPKWLMAMVDSEYQWQLNLENVDSLLNQNVSTISRNTNALEEYKAMMDEINALTAGGEGAEANVFGIPIGQLPEMRDTISMLGELQTVPEYLGDSAIQANELRLNLDYALSSERLMLDVGDQISQGFSDMILEARSIDDIFKSIGKTIISNIVQGLISAIAKATILKSLMSFSFFPFFEKGGIVPAFQTGGLVTGGRPIRGSNEVMIGAQPGEGIVNRKAMQSLGAEGLYRLNRGMMPASNTFNLNINTGGAPIDEKFLRFRLIPELNKLLNQRVYIGD